MDVLPQLGHRRRGLDGVGRRLGTIAVLACLLSSCPSATGAHRGLSACSRTFHPRVGIKALATSSSMDAVAVTNHWLESIVVRLGLCPFAAEPLRNGRIRVEVSGATSLDELLAEVEPAADRLLATSADVVETTLLVAPRLDVAFLEWVQTIGALEDPEAFAEAFPRLADDVMLVCFHPQHSWAGLAADDPVQFEKRSPFPIVNFLRGNAVDSAIEAGLTANIGAHNEQRLRQEGIDVMRAAYSALFAPHGPKPELTSG